MSKLSEQQALVERKAIEAERARAVFSDARASLVAQVRRRIGSPTTLIAAFGAGFALGAHRPRSRAPGAAKVPLPARLLALGTWLGRLNAVRAWRNS